MRTQKSTKVQLIPSEEVVSKPTWTDEQIGLIKNTVAKGATDNELKLFLYTASRTGLDPLTKQIHFVKRGPQMTIQTGIDGYRTIAERTRSLAGIDDAVYEENNGRPTKATVTVYRLVGTTRVPFTASARWSEYAPQGNQAFMWNKMPYLMLGKCAESLALRKAFPNDLTGLYTDEEMHQAEVKTVETPVQEVEVIKPTNIKKEIMAKLKELGVDIKAKETLNEKIKVLTSLDPVEENFEEITSRLSVLISEKHGQ